MNIQTAKGGTSVTPAGLALALAIAAGAIGQVRTGQDQPRAVMVKLPNSSPYLLVLDCTRGVKCRELKAGESVAVADDLMFFSIYSTGVDPTVHHNVVLKIAGVEIPDALNALVPGGRKTQRFNFIVDLQKYKSVRPATPANIDIWVDGKIMTTFGRE